MKASSLFFSKILQRMPSPAIATSGGILLCDFTADLFPVVAQFSRRVTELGRNIVPDCLGMLVRNRLKNGLSTREISIGPSSGDLNNRIALIGDASSVSGSGTYARRFSS